VGSHESDNSFKFWLFNKIFKYHEIVNSAVRRCIGLQVNIVFVVIQTKTSIFN